MQSRLLLAPVCGLLLALVGCDSSAPPQSGPGTSTGPAPAAAKAAPVLLDGSSTVYPVAEAVAEEFRKKNTGIDTPIGIAGTGGGFKRFQKGETDISNASRPILTKEIDECKKNGVKYVELPICFDALTIAVHPKNDWCASMTVAELKKLWEPAAEGKVLKWSDVREGWPAETITLYGAGSDSGTFDYFTEAVNGKAKESRSDYTGSEDDNTLVQGISKNKFSLGYLPFSYYSSNKDILKAVAISAKAGDAPVLPSMEDVQSGKYTPLSRPLFIYVSAKSLERKEVRDFCEFFLTSVGVLAKEVNYLPLPAAAYENGLKRLKEVKTGSVFGGVPETGLTIEALMERELKE